MVGRETERIEIVTGGSQVSLSSTLSTGSSFDVTAGYLTGDDDSRMLSLGIPGLSLSSVGEGEAARHDFIPRLFPRLFLPPPGHARPAVVRRRFE